MPSSLYDPAVDLSRHYDALIFDCDGTLTDSMPLHFIAWRDTLAKYGIVFTEERFYGMGGMPSEKIIAVLCEEQDRFVDVDATAEEKETAFVNSLGQLRALEWVVDAARTHLSKVPMAVASGGIRPIVGAQLDHLSIRDWFPVLVTSEDTQRHKPEPDVFLETARQLNVAPQRCLVWEDSPLGHQAAAAAGMDWIDVLTKTWQRNEVTS